MTESRLSPIGSRALLFEAPCPFDLEHQERFWALAEEASQWSGVREAIPGMTNLTLLMDRVPTDLDILARKLEELWREGVRRQIDGRTVEVGITYGGERGLHLHEVSQITGLTVDQVVEIHSKPDYVVFAVGSHAGYCYLGGLDPRLETPRRKTPLPRLAGGSLSIAGRQTGVSASMGPSGWNTIGGTDFAFFDPSATPAALLAPGDRIRFKPIEVIA